MQIGLVAGEDFIAASHDPNLIRVSIDESLARWALGASVAHFCIWVELSRRFDMADWFALVEDLLIVSAS